MRHAGSLADVSAMEALESRRFLSSTTPYLTQPCLPKPPSTSTPPTAPSSGPTTGNGGTSGGGTSGGSTSGGTQTGTPGTSQRTIPANLLGQWSGTHSADGTSENRGLSILIQTSGNGDFSGQIDYAGTESFSITAPFRYDAKTGKFSVYSLSSKLVVRFQGQYNTSTGAIEGVVQYASRTRGFIGTFSLTLPS